MNELYTWFSQQHHGLRTFRTFQQKLESLSRAEPNQRGLYRLLSDLADGYVAAFDEEPLPVEIADRAHQRLLELLASLDLRADSDRRLADINRVAACDLLH
jgi:ribonucleotide reductase alpha subunit